MASPPPPSHNLAEKIGLCTECTCIIFKLHKISAGPGPSEVQQDHESPSSHPKTPCCSLCLNMLSCNEFQNALIQKVLHSMEPYGGIDANYISTTWPSITLPSLVYIRAHAVLVSIQYLFPSTQTSVSSVDLVTAVKDRLRQVIYTKIYAHHSPFCHHENSSILQSTILQTQEAGYVLYHILLLIPLNHLQSNSTLSSFLLPNKDYLQLLLKEAQAKKGRRRRRHPMDITLKQGGDPRKNLEQRILVNVDDTEPHYFPILEKNQMLDFLSRQNKDHFNIQVPDETSNLDCCCCCKVVDSFTCAWRNPFYVQGRYTKARRDVSQSPFFVRTSSTNLDTAPILLNPSMDEELQGADTLIPTSLQGKIKRLGITSVEEEICPILATIGCGGISTLNNSSASATQQENNKTECRFPEMMYGMCKFHASGREDMNVRMLLPSNECKASVGNIGGRPFVCQVIDAFRLPTDEDLKMVVETINHTQLGSHSEAVDVNRQFGQNPNGVGVSSLQICSSKVFSSLQSETEDKVKYYGCLCWSEKEIPSQEYLENALLHGSIINGSIQSTHPLPNIYPLQILQSTPLRVLHRRSGAVRKRFILSLHASRVSDHYFNLHLSTSGGTYVKEFVHGDCGRTVPNVGTLLGCKTDIMELDCEGVGSTTYDFDENEPEVIEDNADNINI